MDPTVLVVEDDEMIADVVRLSLKPLHIDVVHVANGKAALATIAADPPDVILLDITLPEVDGWEVLSRVRDQPETSEIPVIVMTGRTMPADQVRAYNLGASAYLNKPFYPGELVEKVREALVVPQR